MVLMHSLDEHELGWQNLHLVYRPADFKLRTEFHTFKVLGIFHTVMFIMDERQKNDNTFIISVQQESMCESLSKVIHNCPIRGEPRL